MPHVTPDDLNAFADGRKITFNDIDVGLEETLSTQVLARISQVYDTSTWVDETTTPPLIKSIIAMQYVGWYFERTYSEDANISNYGTMLIAESNTLTDGLANGQIDIPGLPTGINTGLTQPSFYPDDNSSASETTYDDMSLGPAKFSMGMVW